MIHVIEQHSIAKSTTTPSEDAVVVTAYYAAVIDGATPKTVFRYPTGETPGKIAARIIEQYIPLLPKHATAAEAVSLLTEALHQPDVSACNRPTASCVIFSSTRREVWMLGDCQFATLANNGTFKIFTNEKHIDHVLADWRRAVLTSYRKRQLLADAELLTDDPGRHIIQPQITRQTRFQNLDSDHPLAYGMLDGEYFPERFIRIFTVPDDVNELILSSDGYPTLLPTLAETENNLKRLLAIDPLCIGPLLGTKGVRTGNLSYDDRTYLRISL